MTLVRCLALFIRAVGRPVEAQPSFDVVSIRPSKSSDTRTAFNVQSPARFSAVNVTVRRLIEVAYGLKAFQLTGGPGWTGGERFDIEATPGEPDMDKLMPMLQLLLADRFKLVAHSETKEMPMYALVVAKSGSKLKEASGQNGNTAGGPARPAAVIVRRGLLVTRSAPVSALLNSLSNILGRDVVDKTGLSGKYDLRVQWTPDENQLANFGTIGVPEGFGAPPPDPAGPTLFTALEEQLGLELELQKGPGGVLVIDAIEKPSPN
jgi:uncharacterized protein (TIGR03435 family)